MHAQGGAHMGLVNTLTGWLVGHAARRTPLGTGVHTWGLMCVGPGCMCGVCVKEGGRSEMIWLSAFTDQLCTRERTLHIFPSNLEPLLRPLGVHCILHRVGRVRFDIDARPICEPLQRGYKSEVACQKCKLI